MDINWKPRSNELEKDVEEHLRQECLKRGWMCEKFTSPNRRSVPDRMITVPGGRIVFVEVKSITGRLTAGQQRDHERRKKFGCEVYVVYGKPGVDKLLKQIDEGKKFPITEASPEDPIYKRGFVVGKK